MPTFPVVITRTATRTLTVYIDADSADEARREALEGAGDLSFPSEPDAEYEATVLDSHGSVSSRAATVDPQLVDGERPFLVTYAFGNAELSVYLMSTSHERAASQVCGANPGAVIIKTQDVDVALRAIDADAQATKQPGAVEILKKLLENITIDDDGEPFWAPTEDISREQQAALVREARAFVGRANEAESPVFVMEGLKEAISLLKTLYNDISVDDDGDGMLCGTPVDPDDEDSDIEIPLILKTEDFLRRMEKAGIVDDTGVPEVEAEEAEIVEVLQASAAHLTKDEAEFLITKDRYIPGSEGYIHIAANGESVYLALNEGDELAGVSDGFRQVAQYARDRDITYIRFDRDAPAVPSCTTYAW